jgi:hypothetical protein
MELLSRYTYSNNATIGIDIRLFISYLAHKIDQILCWKYKQVFPLDHIEALQGDMCLIYYM